MCGICGILTGQREAGREAVLRMCAQLRHRGPDAEGLESLPLSNSRALILGHRRLSIQDLSPAGNQPMRDPDTGNWIVFNGEIYNYPALRNKLESQGVSFQSHSDTEVILKAYARVGTAMLGELEGMFAFALFDAARSRLLLARDPLGIKPLYHTCLPDGSLMFASEIRALASSRMMPVEMDRTALASALAYGAVQEPLTILKGVRMLEPGEWVEMDCTDPRSRVADRGRFWSFPEPGSFKGSRDEAVVQLRERVDHAISGHLLSDVPVGLFLSAGVDSSAIASVCSRLGRKMEAWTFSMGDAGGVDEVPVAAELARRFGLAHRVVEVSLAHAGEAFDKFADGQDQPGVDGFNTWLMARACREQGGKVALSGLGGDELFGGYEGLQQIPRFHALLTLLRPIPPAWRRRLAAAMNRRLTPCQREKLEDLVGTDWSLNELAVMRRRLFSQAALMRLGFDGARLQRTWLPMEADLNAGTTRRDPLASMGFLDARFYMRNMLLRDSDVHGMAHGMEIRVPWLDSGLAKLILSMPGEWRKPSKGINKPLLVEAAGVPTIVTARRKTGFTLPYAHWLKTGLRDRREAARERLIGQGDLDPAGVRRVFEDFEKHPQGPEWSRIWMLMTLCRWRENFAVLKKEAW